MKTKISTIILIAAVALTSCSKNTDTEDPQSQPSGKYRQVTITAGSSQTKTYVDAGTLKWSDKDKLNIVDQAGKTSSAALDLKSGKDTASGTFEGQVDVTITDETDLYGWCGGSWTYSSGSFSVDMPAEQTYVENGLAKDAYPSIGTGSIKKGITLSNPMGVLKLTVKGAMAGDEVKSITVTSAANNLAGSFTVTPGDTPAVTGGSSKTVTLNIDSPVALSLTDAVNFYIVLPPAEYAANDLTVKITFSDDTYLNYYLTETVTVTKDSATAKEISDHTGRRGTLNNQEWVMIRAKYDGTNYSYLKWAAQNLAVTDSGKAKWNGTNYVIGDYFQWASYDGYVSGTKPGNLVIYDSFSNTCAGGASDSFSFKTGKTFSKASAPYGGTAYTKYTSGSATLDKTDDVANIVLGGTWRIPTGGSADEIKAMCAATYWAWDDTDKGHYVFQPGVGTSGTAGNIGKIGTEIKTKALLFFPATGVGNGTNLKSSGGYGHYWSSTLYYANIDFAYSLYFATNSVRPENCQYRYFGFPVRPVSE